ncbi:MAG: hypothetical protein IPL86_13365 [Flavobacteriales bacterium]|nr:hypothetical protein [Flavobacteriales bacterium]
MANTFLFQLVRKYFPVEAFVTQPSPANVIVNGYFQAVHTILPMIVSVFTFQLSFVVLASRLKCRLRTGAKRREAAITGGCVRRGFRTRARPAGSLRIFLRRGQGLFWIHRTGSGRSLFFWRANGDKVMTDVAIRSLSMAAAGDATPISALTHHFARQQSPTAAPAPPGSSSRASKPQPAVAASPALRAPSPGQCNSFPIRGVAAFFLHLAARGRRDYRAVVTRSFSVAYAGHLFVQVPWFPQFVFAARVVLWPINGAMCFPRSLTGGLFLHGRGSSMAKRLKTMRYPSGRFCTKVSNSVNPGLLQPPAPPRVPGLFSVPSTFVAHGAFAVVIFTVAHDAAIQPSKEPSMRKPAQLIEHTYEALLQQVLRLRGGHAGKRHIMRRAKRL